MKIQVDMKELMEFGREIERLERERDEAYRRLRQLEESPELQSLRRELDHLRTELANARAELARLHAEQRRA